MKIHFRPSLSGFLIWYLFLFTSCSERHSNVGTLNTNVTVGEITRAVDFFNVHSSKPKFIEVAGKRYIDVRGKTPYYLSLPEKDSILFVTEEGRKSVIHLVNLRTKNDIAIPFAGSFGIGIGSGKTNGAPYTDWIEDARQNQITLVSRGFQSANTLVLDTSKQRVIHHQTDYFDENGIVTNREILVNDGRKSKNN